MNTGNNQTPPPATPTVEPTAKHDVKVGSEQPEPSAADRSFARLLVIKWDLVSLGDIAKMIAAHVAAATETLRAQHAARVAELDRESRLVRISAAEALGYKRGAPYADLGVNKPRWYFNGGYYDFHELPTVDQSLADLTARLTQAEQQLAEANRDLNAVKHADPEHWFHELEKERIATAQRTAINEGLRDALWRRDTTISSLTTKLAAAESALALATQRLTEAREESTRLREVRSATLAHLRISDSEYALRPIEGDEHYSAEFRRLLRALYTTMKGGEPTAQAEAAVARKLFDALTTADYALHALAKIMPTTVHEIYGDAEHETDSALAAYRAATPPLGTKGTE